MAPKTVRKRQQPKQGANTRKHRVKKRPTSVNTSLIVKTLLEMLNTVKIYHWNTLSYAQHKATDKLYEELNDSIDTFVEILLGKTDRRIEKMVQMCRHYDFKATSKTEEPNPVEFKQKIHEYRRFLTDLNRVFSSNKDSDLLNVRDEIVGQLNQFLYLFSFH